ncbi:MAG: DUF1178 domain-containing protein [Tagaea sp. CACIAM 22H2]|nr:DUF1178 domain-containing protein [Tagaea sp. CACIAM 22H2]
MIVFDLQCRKKHRFQSWFKDGASFDRQAKRGLVECPVCGDVKIEKALMAPRLAGTKKSRKRLPVPAEAVASEAATQVAAGPDPATAKAAELHKELAKLREHVEKNFENVGGDFAEQARAMHYGEREHKNIYGETTDEQARELVEEGVPVARIPWVRRNA